MPSLPEIRAQIANLDGLSKFLGKREIKELPNILWENEKVVNILQGRYSNGVGILVATNKRLVFVDKGMLWGLKVEDFPYDKVTSIQYDTSILTGSLTIFASGNKAVIDQVDKKSVKVFGEWLRNHISSGQTVAVDSNGNGSNTADVADQIEKLGRLKEQGLLTEEEFQSQKQKLLNI